MACCVDVDKGSENEWNGALLIPNLEGCVEDGR